MTQKVIMFVVQILNEFYTAPKIGDWSRNLSYNEIHWIVLIFTNLYLQTLSELWLVSSCVRHDSPSEHHSNSWVFSIQPKIRNLIWIRNGDKWHKNFFGKFTKLFKFQIRTVKWKIWGRKSNKTRIPGRNFRKFDHSSQECPLFTKFTGNFLKCEDKNGMFG